MRRRASTDSHITQKVAQSEVAGMDGGERHEVGIGNLVRSRTGVFSRKPAAPSAQSTW